MESTLSLLSLVGVAVFAMSGALVAHEDKFDLVGALFLAIATAIGGGTIVDLVIGHTPVRWVADPTPLFIAAIAGLIAYGAVSAARLPSMTHRLMIWADAVGLAVFTATGMERLVTLGFDPIVCAFLAAVGASGGGMLRDVLANRTPIVFARETELYVTAAFAGAAAYLAVRALVGEGAHLPLIAALVVTGVVRAAGIVFGLTLSGKKTR